MNDTDVARAALRGNPSFVWRAGQERRLHMILEWAPSGLRRVLVNGCGVGMYLRALQEWSRKFTESTSKRTTCVRRLRTRHALPSI